MSFTTSTFYLTADEKISEENVSISFSTKPGKEGKHWLVEGTGSNKFGDWTVKGEYRFKKGENKMVRGVGGGGGRGLVKMYQGG